MTLHAGKTSALSYSEKLELLLSSKNVWHRFIEFSEPVKTVEQAGRKVQVEKIAKSIVMVDSAGDSLLAIVRRRAKSATRNSSACSLSGMCASPPRKKC